MKAATIATIIDFSIILPFGFAISGKHPIVPYYLIAAAIIALMAIGFRWYKNLGFEDRFLLAAQISILLITALMQFSQSLFLSEMAYYILFYVILIIIGIYTTFWTRAGFIGIIGDPHVVRKDSLILLSFTIVAALGVMCLPDFLPLWLAITAILWRSCMRLKW